MPSHYTVREGDTLWGIAASVYGDGARYCELLTANPGLQQLVETDGLVAGQTVRLAGRL